MSNDRDRLELLGFDLIKAKDASEVISALYQFLAGGQGSSVKTVDIEGKSHAEIEQFLLKRGWRKTEETTTTDGRTGEPCTPYRQVFYEHQGGGVVRLKPDGMPDAKFGHATKAHGTKYVKKDRLKGLAFLNEAFKVHGARAIPRVFEEVALPPGTDKREAEERWAEQSHVPLRADPRSRSR